MRREKKKRKARKRLRNDFAHANYEIKPFISYSLVSFFSLLGKGGGRGIVRVLFTSLCTAQMLIKLHVFCNSCNLP